jgi:hypothetical protein
MKRFEACLNCARACCDMSCQAESLTIDRDRIRMDNRSALKFRCTLVFVLAVQFSGFAFAQSPPQGPQWPDNIIITKRLLGESKVDENQMSVGEASAVAVCAQLGKLYEPGTLRKAMGEGDVVTAQTTYLSGRRKLVITESLMLADGKDQTCIGRYRLGWTYDYTDPREAWTVVRSPKGVYSPKRQQKDSPELIRRVDGAFQSRLRKFQGEWRNRKYSEVESRFGQRCGYPPNPSDLPKPQGMGDYGAFYDKAIAAAQKFHSEGPKLCSLMDSPEHVGTGEKLVLHFKESQRSYDDKTGCYDLNDSGGVIRKKCIPIVVDFKVNAAMPAGIFEKPDWARGAGPAPSGGNSPGLNGASRADLTERAK